MKQKIIIDTDCGMDDIIAIAMIISDKDILIDEITTVRGLTDPIVGMKNLNKILVFGGKEIRISAGSKYPLKKIRRRNMFPEQDIINSSKLSFLTNLIGNDNDSKNNFNKSDNVIYKNVYKNKKKITILCLGPLTNIAVAIKKYKNKFIKKIAKLIIMGGAVFSPGNVSSFKKAEYNFFLDPESAEIVLQSGIPIFLVSTDITKLIPATEFMKRKILQKNPQTGTGKIIQKIIISNNKDFRYFYDPLAASILLDPKIITETKTTCLKVTSRGQSLITKSGSNITVVTKINKKRFYKLLFQKLV